MSMYVLLAFLLLFMPLFFHVPNKQQPFSFMSIEYTTVLRAVAILMVMQQHLSGFVFGSRVFTPFGGGGVAIFLIVSGFGLTMSAKKKGVDDFWKKKFVRVFLPWMLVWLIVVLQNVKGFQLETVLSLFTPNWFLQYLFVCYVVFYVSYKWMYRYRFQLLAIFALATFFFWGNIQAEQCCSFQVGVLLAEREDILCGVKRNIKNLFAVSLLFFIVMLGLKQCGAVRMLMEANYVVEHALNLVLKLSLGIFVMMACAIFFRFISGEYAKFVGKISYELYLVHLSLVLGLCYKVVENPIAPIIVFIVVSFVASWLLYNVDNKILEVYSKYINKKANE